MSVRARLAAASLCAALPSAALHAQSGLIAHDDFVGPKPNLGGTDGGTGWETPWIDNNAGVVTSVSAAGLSYPGVGTANGAAFTAIGLPPNYSSYERAFSLPPEWIERLYLSVLLRPDPFRGTYTCLEFGDEPDSVYLGVLPEYQVYGLRLGTGVLGATNAPVVSNETVLLVLEIHRDGELQETNYRLYVNPDVRLGQPLFPSVHVATLGVPPLTKTIRFKGDGGYTTDEIRIGLTWDSVLDEPCYADCDESAFLSIADFGCFQTAFLMNSAYADCNASGTFTMADFACFQASFTACPED